MADDLDAEVAALWQRLKPAALERCDVLRRASATAPDADLLGEARSESHKLAGALGMYGLVEAGALASRIDALVVDGALSDGRRAEVATLVDELADAVRADR